MCKNKKHDVVGNKKKLSVFSVNSGYIIKQLKIYQNI